MASKNASLPEFCCSICGDLLKDPRLLECGHHFCLDCLQRLLHDNSIACPICRNVTLVDQGDAGKLCRHKQTNLFSQAVAQAVKTGKETPETKCDQCTEEDKRAIKYCKDCCSRLCEDCAKKHSKVEIDCQHCVWDMSSYILCHDHPDCGKHFLCLKCGNMCCIKCVLGNHCDHDLQDVNKAADKIKARIHDLHNDLIETKGDENLQIRIEELLSKSREALSQFEVEISKIKSSLEDLNKKINETREKVNQKLTSDIKELEIMKFDIKDYMASKTSLLELINKLTETASSPEIIARESELPKYDKETYKQVISKTFVEIPDLQVSLPDVKEKLEKCQTNITILYNKYYVGNFAQGNPLSDLKLVDTISTGKTVYGLVFDSKRERIIVRQCNAVAPISIYDFQGQRLRVLGKDIHGINANSHQSISLDTRRDLYLVPMGDGTMITLDLQGSVRDRIQVTNTYLQGVTYSLEDIYITSSPHTTPHQVFFINPVDKQITRTLNMNSLGPYCITDSNHTTVGGGKPVVLVSCDTGNCIKVFNHTGGVLHTFGTEGKAGNGELLSTPFGVCTDPGGRILVCDYSNHRIVSFWIEGGENKWETLLDQQQLMNKTNPWSVACDASGRRLFVGMSDGSILVFSH